MRRYNGLETPLLRVSRPVAACSRCRAAKIKCDGKLPACTACEKTGRESECSSSNDQFAKGKERSYVASLESRIEKLEKRVAYAKMRKASVAMHEREPTPPPPPADRKDSLASIRAAIHGKAARKREASDVNELVSDFGFLSVNATTRDFEASTTNMTFARLILAASMNEPMPTSRTNQLPSRTTARALIQYYLDTVFSLFPSFHEAQLFHALDVVYKTAADEAIYKPHARITTYKSHTEEFEHWLLFMVLGIGAVGQSRSFGDAYYRDGVSWVSRALRHADTVLATGHITQIQSLILLVQYSMLDPTHFDSWQLIGFACRALVDLGFHQDPPKGQQPDRKTLDFRRRIFHCVYALDRSISMVHARAFSFTDNATSVAYPCTPSLLTQSSSGKPDFEPRALREAILLFQLRRAQSTWYQELFQSSRDPLQQSSTYIWDMCREMRVWSESFPKTLSLATRELFELELLYSYVYCLAPSCRVPAVSELGKTLIFEYSLSYMEKIYAICQDPTNPAFYTYHDALRVYFIGSQFLAVLSANLDQLLSAITPFTAAMAGGPPIPQRPTNSGHIDNINRSLDCIDEIIETLRTYGDRWDDSRALQASFEQHAEDIRVELNRRRQRRDMHLRNSRTPETSHSTLAPHNHIDNLLSDEWASVGHMFADGTMLQNNRVSAMEEQRR